MTVEFNNSAVSTQPAETPVVETPDFGQVETPVEEVVEQAEVETENAGELPKNYKELQAEFTRKSQELSEIKKQQEKAAQELAVYRQMYAEQNTPKPAQQPSGLFDKELSAKEYAALEPMEQLDYLIDRRMSKNVKPYIDKISQLENYIQANIQQESQRAWNEFVAAHPDAANMAGDLAQIIEKHNMPIDKAYKFLKADMALPEAKQEVLKEIQVKKDASKLMKPVSTPTTPANNKVNSIEEAFEKSLKGLGIK